MKIFKLLLCCLFLSPCVSASSQRIGRVDVDADDSVRQFVQGFYSWYVKEAIASRSVSAWSKAINEKGGAFDSELRRELGEDVLAQKEAVGEIVGLDFDPFLNGQDPSRDYVVLKVVSNGEVYFAEVHRVVSGRPEEKVAVTAVIAGKKGRWRFVDFLYPDNHHLLGILKALKEDRDKPTQ